MLTADVHSGAGDRFLEVEHEAPNKDQDDAVCEFSISQFSL